MVGAQFRLQLINMLAALVVRNDKTLSLDSAAPLVHFEASHFSAMKVLMIELYKKSKGPVSDTLRALIELNVNIEDQIANDRDSHANNNNGDEGKSKAPLPSNSSSGGVTGGSDQKLQNISSNTRSKKKSNTDWNTVSRKGQKKRDFRPKLEPFIVDKNGKKLCRSYQQVAENLLITM